MPKVSLYLPDLLAEEVREQQIALSAVCQRALREEIERLTVRDVMTDQMERLEVELWGPNGSPYGVTFVGMWLVAPDDDNRFSEADAGACYGIALTKRNRFAIYEYHCNGRWAPRLTDYDTLAAAAAAGEPQALLAMAAAMVGEGLTVDLDI